MMKLSIITPTNNIKYLQDLEKSILNNTYEDWEWIILLNNGAKYSSDNNRIRVCKSAQKTTSVGALKYEACQLATGEVIVEVDHDDMITPDCLSEIAEGFKDPDVGFVYSDNAKLADNFIPYDKKWG